MRKKDNQGFTLIEVIVSVAIGSIVLGVILSLILTSFTTFGTISTEKLKKNALDNIVDYVREEVENSTDVVISKTPPKLNSDNENQGQWKWLSVINNRLYLGNYTYDIDNKTGSGTGKEALDDSYYGINDTYDRNHDDSTLSLYYAFHLRNSNDTNSDDKHSYIVNFQYVLKNTTTTYKKNDAIEFSNVHKESDETYNTGDLRDNESMPEGNDKSPISLNNTISQVQSFNQDGDGVIRLYYHIRENDKGSKNESNNNYLSHTVADKIYTMTPYLNRGYYLGTSSSVENNEFYTLPLYNTYRVGDFVYYKGYWYMAVKDNVNNRDWNAPGGGAGSLWQRLSEELDSTSYYFKDDIIRHNNKYYRCLKETSGYNSPEWAKDYWEDLGKNKPTSDGYDTSFKSMNDEHIIALMKLNQPIKNSPAYEKQIKISRFSYQGTDQNISNKHVYATDYPQINEYKPNKTYQIGDYVKVRVDGSEGNRDPSKYAYYEVYKKIFEPEDKDKSIKPGQKLTSGWKLLENSYHPGSSYEKGDALRIGTGYSSETKLDGSDNDYILFENKDYKAMMKFSKNEYIVWPILHHTFYKYSCDFNFVGNRESKLYFGLKTFNVDYNPYNDAFNYIDPNTIKGSYNYYHEYSSITDFGFYDGREAWLEKAMIYYDEDKAKNSGNMQDIAILSNSDIRKTIWQKTSYNKLLLLGGTD